MITPHALRTLTGILTNALNNGDYVDPDAPVTDTEDLEDAMRFTIQTLNQRATALEETKNLNQGGTWPSIK